MDKRGGNAPLTAEQMRDVVSRLLEGVNASDPGELAGEFLRDDGEFSQQLLSSIPRLIGTAAAMVTQLAASLDGMPEEKRAELLAEALSQVDGKQIGEAVNAVSSLLIGLHEHDPDLYPGKRLDIASGVVNELDFGKLRKALIYRNQERMELLRNEAELMSDQPMAVINLFGVISPMVNNLLAVLNTTLESLSLPSEAMAYAIFKILQDIDWAEFTSIINGLTGLVVTLHRGSLILGNGSMESRGVFARVSEDIVSNLNAQEFAEAIQALGAEGEALLSSLANAITKNEDLMLWLTGALTMVTNSYLTTVANAAERVGALPAETLGKIADEIAEDFEAREMGRALNNLLVLGGRIRTERPELFSSIVRKALSATELGKMFAPEAIGSGISKALASYNELSLDNTSLIEENLDAFLASVDARQLSAAARSTSAQIVGATSRHPEVMKVLFKALISIAYGAVKGYVKNLINLGPKKGREVKAG